MNARTAAAALALGTLWASGVRALEWETLDREFCRAAVAALRRLDASREHAAFALRERIDLVIAPRGKGFSADALGSYDARQRRMYLDKKTLLAGAEELSAMGLRPEEVSEALAWKMLPTLVHELGHGMIGRKLQDELRVPFNMPVLEDEMLSFFDEVLVLHDSFAARPELWHPGMILDIEEDQAALLQAWRRRTEDLQESVRRAYPKRFSVLEAEDSWLWSWNASETLRDEKLLAEVRALRRRVAAAPPGEIPEADRKLRELRESERTARNLLEEDRRIRRVLADPVLLGRLRAFYRRELAARVRALAALREALPAQ